MEKLIKELREIRALVNSLRPEKLHRNRLLALAERVWVRAGLVITSALASAWFVVHIL